MSALPFGILDVETARTQYVEHAEYMDNDETGRWCPSVCETCGLDSLVADALSILYDNAQAAHYAGLRPSFAARMEMP